MKVEKLQGSHAMVPKRIEKLARKKAAHEGGSGKVALLKFPKFKLVIQKSESKSALKTETASSEKKQESRKSPNVRAVNYISKERMKRFLRMTPADLPRPTRKTYACERDIKLIKAPKDTIRCTACGVLYERVKRNEHLKDCKKTVSEQHKYACASCNFKHADIKEIEVHVETTHRKKGGATPTSAST